MIFSSEELLKTAFYALGHIHSTSMLESAIGLNDSKKLMERFFSRMLGVVFDLELEVMDRIKPSFPAIDLGDS